MGYLEDVRGSTHVVGDSSSRSLLVLAVVGLLLLASGGFVIGLNVGLSLGWIVLTLGIAIVAGLVGAGLVPTIGSLWLIGLWWFVFLPLVGYLTGSWAGSTRYNHPRMLGYGYTSARAELFGGVEYGVQFGLPFAVLLGSSGYAAGVAIDRMSKRMKASR
ncbi:MULTISPECIES: hypothetical protein [Haloferacaceae]|uniref:Uncharacterized protein n=1 Tax=Halorubrum glutamatedens TaxID=2707018 RepID=A0ABD5QQE2_9EURY|nr:hypothetical protein [Halobellus captivus]